MKFYQNKETIPWRTVMKDHDRWFYWYNGHTRQCEIKGMRNVWFKDNLHGDWGVEIQEQCNMAWLQGNHTAYFTKHQAVLNLKHVPKSIKDADYKDFSEWMSAVWAHIAAARAKAKFKADAKESNRKTEQALEFMNFKDEMEPMAKRLGFEPTTDVPDCCKTLKLADGTVGLFTWNDVWAHHPKDNWRKDSVQFKKGKMKVTADIQRCGNKLTIQGISSQRIRDALLVVCKLLEREGSAGK
jgi:hypothetical protein